MGQFKVCMRLSATRARHRTVLLLAPCRNVNICGRSVGRIRRM